MKIVVLDGYTLNPGDLSWSELDKLGETHIFERTSPKEVAERCADADIVLTNKTSIDRKTIYSSDRIKYIGVLATGYNVVDVVAAREKNIPVTNAGSYGTMSAMQHTFALLLELTNHVGVHTHSVHEGDWVSSKDFCYLKSSITELQDKVLGIIGLGRIGKAVANTAKAFGMKVICFHTHPERDQMEGVAFKELDEVFKLADYVSLHCPLTPSNKEMVNGKLLKSMKPTAYLVNTSRGGLVSEAELADCLNSGIIAGAALDVLSEEPPQKENPLLYAKNCLITPHIAWATIEARRRLLQIATENVECFINGEPRNVVN